MTRIALGDLLARPETLPPLAHGEAAVWILRHDMQTPVPSHLHALLDQAETRQAAAFLREADRRRFVLAHAALRVILSAHTKTPPPGISYAFSAQGKPSLVRGGPEFNLSHAGDCILVAVSLAGPVGVDVEPVRPLPDAEHLVERFFAAEERRAYQACAEADRPKAFFTLWTRKEAYVKALGLGLGMAFDAFAVSQDSPARVLRRHAPASSPAVDLWDIPAPAGYAAALAGQVAGMAVHEVRP